MSEALTRIVRRGLVVTVYEPRPPFGPLTWGEHNWLWSAFPRYYEVVPFAEIARRCVEMGLLVCTCVGVDACTPDGRRRLILDPACTVHLIVDCLPL